jgi:AAA+ superfamily predicted ATPase
MTDSPAIEELCKRIDWISALFSLRTATDDTARAAASSRVMETYARVASREGGTKHELLRERLGLSETELQVIWLLAALAIDARTKNAMLTQNVVGPAVTIDTLRRIVYGERPSAVGFRELAPNGTLRHLAIIERNDGHPHDSAETRWTWTLAPRVLAWLHGDDRVDPALAAIAHRPSRAPIPDALALPAGALADARKALNGTGATIVVSGAAGLGRRTMLVSLAAEYGLETLCIDCSKLPEDAVALATQLRALGRECRLLDCVPILVNIDALGGETATDRRLETVGREFVSLIQSNVLATSGPQRPTTRWNRPTIVIELDQPTSEHRARVWRAALGDEAADDASRLARAYPLAPALIHHAATTARARAGSGLVQPHDIAAGIRAVLDDRLGQLARRVTVTQTWDDLVLPQEQMESIVDLVARVRESARVYEDWGFGKKVGKGFGVSALFSGPPGTGKTMVAALIARDLGLELYEVDFAKVVSKWIGESERNLAKLFDAAEAGYAILLFDEADALFGKRTEVKSSNDRYANLETNYLLQRLESFTGVCLLTTNHESNIDPAFQRRLSLHVRFDLPEPEERLRLWRTMLSAAVPVDPNVDMKQLARRFELSGGSIRNAVLRGAFFAADKGTALTMPLLERAARLELEALGKIAW